LLLGLTLPDDEDTPRCLLPCDTTWPRGCIGAVWADYGFAENEEINISSIVKLALASILEVYWFIKSTDFRDSEIQAFEYVIRCFRYHQSRLRCLVYCLSGKTYEDPSSIKEHLMSHRPSQVKVMGADTRKADTTLGEKLHKVVAKDAYEETSRRYGVDTQIEMASGILEAERAEFVEKHFCGEYLRNQELLKASEKKASVFINSFDKDVQSFIIGGPSHEETCFRPYFSPLATSIRVNTKMNNVEMRNKTMKHKLHTILCRTIQIANSDVPDSLFIEHLLREYFSNGFEDGDDFSLGIRVSTTVKIGEDFTIHASKGMHATNANEIPLQQEANEDGEGEEDEIAVEVNTRNGQRKSAHASPIFSIIEVMDPSNKAVICKVLNIVSLIDLRHQEAQEMKSPPSIYLIVLPMELDHPHSHVSYPYPAFKMKAWDSAFVIPVEDVVGAICAIPNMTYMDKCFEIDPKTMLNSEAYWHIIPRERINHTEKQIMDINYLQQSENALFPSKEIINAWALRMDNLSEKIETRKLLFASKPLNTKERNEKKRRQQEEFNREVDRGSKKIRQKISRQK